MQSEIFKRSNANDINSSITGDRVRILRSRLRLFGFWVRVRVRIWRCHVSRWVMVSWSGHGRLIENTLSFCSTVCIDILGYFVSYPLKALLVGQTFPQFCCPDWENRTKKNCRRFQSFLDLISWLLRVWVHPGFAALVGTGAFAFAFFPEKLTDSSRL